MRSSGAVLKILKNGQEVKSVSLGAEEAALGRGEECVIRLEDRAVSRRHATFKATQMGVEIKKTSDFAPMSVNGAEVTQALVKFGDVISIGPYLIRLAEEIKSLPPGAVSVTPAEVPAQESAPEPAPVLNVQKPKSGTGNEPKNSAESQSDLSLNGPELELSGASAEVNPEEGSMILGQGGLDLNSGFDINSEGDGGPALEEPSSGMPDEVAIQFGESENDDSSSPALDEDAATKILGNTQIKAVFRFTSGSANVDEFLLSDKAWANKEISIGRGKDCQIILNDKKASRKNTSVSQVGAKFVLKDLGSANGTYVNNEKLVEGGTHDLVDGDTVRIGGVEFTFHALSRDYERKQNQLLQVDAVEEESAFSSPQQVESLVHESPAPGAGMADFGVPLTNDPNPGVIAGISGGQTKKKSLMEKFRELPPQKQIIYGGAFLALMWFLSEDDPAPPKPKRKPKAKTEQTQEAGDKKKRVFAMLSAEQKKFIEAQYQLAFDLYKNREYDKTLFELTKIFTLVDDYEKARELERYAKEGKRKLEAIEEERKRKEEEARVKARLEGLLSETRELMGKKEYEKVEPLFAEILSIDPDNKEVDKWKVEIKDRLQAIELEKQRKHVLSEINRQAWGVFNEGMDLKKKGKWHEAIKRLEEVETLKPSDQKLLDRVDDEITGIEEMIDARRDPFLAKAKEAEGAGNLHLAFAFYKKAYQSDPPHPAAPAAMKRLRGTLVDAAKRLYTEGVLAESFSDFGIAKKKFQECLSVAPEDDIYHERAQRRLASYYRHEKAPDSPDKVDSAVEPAEVETGTDQGVGSRED